MHDACVSLIMHESFLIWHRMHIGRTISSARVAFKGNIYQQNICTQIVLPHHFLNIYN
jgi:hypothetical protein